jgi:hypothetical protein
MSKIKQKYYDFEMEACKHFGGLESDITDYVELLEKQNKEMLEALIDFYSNVPEFARHENNAPISKKFKKMVSVIEKATGLTIEEACNES